MNQSPTNETLANLSREELLAGLRDIQMPPAPPQFSDWPVIAALLIILLAAVALLTPSSRRRQRQRGNWIRRLEAIDTTDSEDGRLALALFCRDYLNQAIAQNDSDAMTNMPERLDRHFRTQYFTEGPGKILARDLYSRADEAQLGRLHELKQELIRLIRAR